MWHGPEIVVLEVTEVVLGRMLVVMTDDNSEVVLDALVLVVNVNEPGSVVVLAEPLVDPARAVSTAPPHPAAMGLASDKE